ncbi:unnamed protein product [Gordionus sp. m RMFG-2023]
MQFCPRINSRDFFKWEHGFNPCFIETLSSTSIFIFIFIFGLIQIRIYKKYSIELEYWQRANTFGFHFQVTLICFISSLSLIRVILQNTVKMQNIYVVDPKDKFYYYTIIVGFLYFASWMMCLKLIFLERKRTMPGLPPRGHGLTLITFWALCLIWENLSFINWCHEYWWWNIRNLSDKLEVSLFSLRYICTTTLFLIGIRAPALLSTPIFTYIHQRNSPDNPPASDSWYIRFQRNKTNSDTTNLQSQIGPSPADPTNSAWKGVPLLRFKLFLCIMAIIAARVINVALPMTYKAIIDSLTKKEYCWKTFLVFVGLQLLQGFGVGGSGLLTNFRSFLWISIQQYSTKKLQVEMYSHILSLSLEWHINKKTGEILRVLERGTQSINNILNYVSFQVGPTLIDILVAIIYLMVYFGVWYSLIVVITMIMYIVSTILITEWRTSHRREMNRLDNIITSKATETFFNFEAVKYHAAEWFEISKYDEAISNFQKEEWITSSSLNGLNCIQGLICVLIGLLGGGLLCAYQIVNAHASTHSTSFLTVGDFVLYVSYLSQLYAPLNWFGTFYRSIQQSLIDLENLVDLIKQTPYDKTGPLKLQYIQESRNNNPPWPCDNNNGSRSTDYDTIEKTILPPLFITDGKITFRDVYFSYQSSKVKDGNNNQSPITGNDKDQNKSAIDYSSTPSINYALKGINFEIGSFSNHDGIAASTQNPKILGIVGPSGSGKSTIFKLIFGLYRPTQGQILIDDQDIAEVDPLSLRSQLGHVPQDAILFNKSINYNIDYGTFSLLNSSFDANTDTEKNAENTSEAILKASRSALIHDTISRNMPKGYETVVGERGLRLSGGEKQRVAIARVILKSPKIILLDEATSSLDSNTESIIQNNLNKVFGNDATIVIIAHRLSTVVQAHEIIVIDKGCIVERGSHQQLLTLKNGLYAEMWDKQLRQKENNSDDQK